MTNPKWKYGDCWERFPIEEGEVWQVEPRNSLVAVHNIFNPLPAFMGEADLLFVDPPWNVGNLNSFYTKAGRDDYHKSFSPFTSRLLECIGQISPRTCYIEMGNQFADEWEQQLKGMFPVVQRWSVLYYRKHPTNLIRATTAEPTAFAFSGIDEAKCISLIAQTETYTTMGDLCMGRGLVGMAAHRAGKRFVGTELNKRRLANLLDNLNKAGAIVSKSGTA